MTVLQLIGIVGCVAGSLAAGVRWLRVLQREHYLSGSTLRFAIRWWTTSPMNTALFLAGVAAAVVAIMWPLVALITAGVALVGPKGLSLRGRTSKLSWTRRLKTVAVVSAVLEVAIVAVCAALHGGAAAAAFCALGMPLLVDAAAGLLTPVERRLGKKFVDQAASTLKKVNPLVVGITGSYGKTSTKNHLVTLVGSDRAVVPSPRSFNNRAGLSRAINEHLALGTDVFVAEMGTYGPGEIADMVAWCPPSIAVLTAIGPVHLERFGSLDVTLAAKAELTGPATTVVLVTDNPYLERLRPTLGSRRVITVSATDPSATVAILQDGDDWRVLVEGVERSRVPVPSGVQPTNAGCALGAALAIGIDPTQAALRVGELTAVENRQSILRAPSGVTIIDDTFNSNPEGARAALSLLASLPVDGRRCVVTPGMIELGREQAEENARFAELAAQTADVLLIVGATNRRALRAGVKQSDSGIEVIEVATRPEAVAWVRSALGARDAVLYENDFPDHYP